MRVVRLSVALGLVVAVSGVAAAQATGSESGGRSNVPAAGARPFQGGRGARAAGRAGQDPAALANRQALARQVRQAFNAVVRRQLDLNDEKWRQLQKVERRYQQQRGQLQRDEKATRLGLAAAIQDSARAGGVDQEKIAQYLDQLVQAQHRRADLLGDEQKELASFLTPLQRAKYQGLREQFNQRVNAARKGAVRGAPPPPQP